MASGDYSTTIGYNNKNGGKYSFCGGSNNFIKDYEGSAAPKTTFVFGNNNGSSQYRYTDCCVLGNNNVPSINGHALITIGNGNRDRGYGGATFGDGCKNNGAYLYGDHLNVNASGNHPKCIVGSYNKDTYSLSAPRFVIGVGSTDYGAGDRKNAIEIDATNCKIINDLQLNTDTTAVNAITPPQDPNNVTQSDKTLATQSYLGAALTAFTLRSEKLLEYTDTAQAPTVPTDGTSLDFSPIIPAWAKHIWVYFKWEGESYTEDIMVDVNNGVHLDAQQYDTSQPLTARLEHDHVRMDYNASTKTLTAIDFWYYDHDLNNNTIANIDTTLSDCPPIYVMSVIATA